MSSLELFKSNILPKAIASGSFGKNAELVKVIEDSTEGKDQFASSILFVEIEVRIGATQKNIPIICKFQCESAQRREKFKTYFQFFNEVQVYQEIMPLFPINVLDYIPEFYYGVSTLMDSPESDVIIVENLIPRGFRHSSDRVYLDFDHCALVFNKLGEFHGASLQVKSKSPLKFANKINKLKETRWDDKAKEENNRFFGENAKRGVIPLIKQSDRSTDLESLNRFLNKLSDVYLMMADVLQVNEMSVLCHGDFCRNNMVFKYEENKPVDVKFFDLATARYSSPVIDISFFLFLNTSLELRRKHFKDDFLKIYFDALHRVAGSESPTIDELWKEFQQKAVYGYILASFFLPIMLDDKPVDLDERMKMTEEEIIKESISRGGEEVTMLLSEQVRDLIHWDCLGSECNE